MFDYGLRLVIEGKIEEALVALSRVKELNSEWEFSPKEEVANVLVKHGSALSRIGDLDGALMDMRKAKELNPNLDLIPEEEVARILVERAKSLAIRSDMDNALMELRKAKEIDPNLDLFPEVEVAKILVMNGDVEGALNLMRKAKESDASLDLNPQVEAAKMLVERAVDQAWSGDLEAGIKAFADAKKLDPLIELSAIDISAEDWNTLCWDGSLHGYAAEVLDACEQAVSLAPEDGGIRDSRGLARALTEDLEGAIDDFSFFVEWSISNGVYEEYRQVREDWIAVLKAGKNPIDEATLEAAEMMS